MRAVTIIPLVLTHVIMYFDWFGLDPFILGKTDEGTPRLLDIGIYCLGIFFGISGFLITYLLRLERQKTGKVYVKRFYMRRALRIFPLYYWQILFCLMLYAIFKIEYTQRDLVMYLFYAVNIPFLFGGVLPFLGHYWTLAVEEQFYLFWPWFNKMSNRQLLWFCWISLILFIVVRAILNTLHPQFILLKLMNHLWFQCMLIGAIFSLHYIEHRTALMKIAENTWVQVVCWLLLLIGCFNLLVEFLPLDIEITTAIGCLILLNQNSNKVFINFERKSLDYYGRLSYATYIVHIAIIFLCSELIPWEYVTNIPLRYVLVTIVIFAATTFNAHLAYKYLETPFLRLKEKKYTFVEGLKTK